MFSTKYQLNCISKNYHILYKFFININKYVKFKIENIIHPNNIRATICNLCNTLLCLVR